MDVGDESINYVVRHEKLRLKTEEITQHLIPRVSSKFLCFAIFAETLATRDVLQVELGRQNQSRLGNSTPQIYKSR